MSIPVSVGLSSDGSLELTGAAMPPVADVIRTGDLLPMGFFNSAIRPTDPKDFSRRQQSLPLDEYVSLIYNPGREQGLMAARLINWMSDNIQFSDGKKADPAQLSFVACAIVDNINGLHLRIGIRAMNIHDLPANLRSVSASKPSDTINIIEKLFNVQIDRQNRALMPRAESAAGSNTETIFQGVTVPTRTEFVVDESSMPVVKAES